MQRLSRASPPGPLSIFDGEGEEVLAHGSWGGLRPDMVQLWRICTVFFSFFLSFPVDVSCRTDETMFKGVQIVQFTLTLAGF